jgi:hypothetical protein
LSDLTIEDCHDRKSTKKKHSVEEMAVGRSEESITIKAAKYDSGRKSGSIDSNDYESRVTPENQTH